MVQISYGGVVEKSAFCSFRVIFLKGMAVRLAHKILNKTSHTAFFKSDRSPSGKPSKAS